MTKCLTEFCTTCSFGDQTDAKKLCTKFKLFYSLDVVKRNASTHCQTNVCFLPIILIYNKLAQSGDFYRHFVFVCPKWTLLLSCRKSIVHK